eukprot:CAMPEP_0113852706 /NCGR_PEP_ID=MMETSP0372-20130328/5741_1 /TAXON_ID=340204 /ORGANISM="Lankesteria abbotti" /LENGTH=52 /DNA_ID=CAMNT_0000824449 /DNA_START=134 /DNA_END=289 /DNA_ORIENTATION=+ /assembly_acc=CAM_ASM_000359
MAAWRQQRRIGIRHNFPCDWAFEVGARMLRRRKFIEESLELRLACRTTSRQI